MVQVNLNLTERVWHGLDITRFYFTCMQACDADTLNVLYITNYMKRLVL